MPAHPQPTMVSPAATSVSAAEHVHQLYIAHAAELWLGLSRLAGPQLDADDLLHEVFMVALRRSAEVQRADSPKAWLYGVAIKIAASRRRVVFARRLVGLEAAAEVASAESPMRTVEQRDASKQVERVLSKLPAAKREVFVLFELQGVSGPDIAEALGVPLKTVWTRLFHARKAFSVEFARLEAIERRTTGLTGGPA